MKSMKNQKLKIISMHIYTIYNNGSIEKKKKNKTKKTKLSFFPYSSLEMSLST